MYFKISAHVLIQAPMTSSSPLKIAMTLGRAGDTPSGQTLTGLVTFPLVSRMLNGAEKSQVVGCGLRVADFARERAAHKLAQQARARAFDRNGVDAVILGERAWRASVDLFGKV